LSFGKGFTGESCGCTFDHVRTPSPIYVETLIGASMEALWFETQDPSRHRQWDLRFTEISYLPKSVSDGPQQFLYATRIGFGLRIEGRGESVANRNGPAGEHTSVLRFWSDDPKSIIREGGGYWRYLPEPGGVRFLTLYSYRPRGGVVGAWFDRLIFRPILGRATAWSFDCLRIALESGASPRQLWTQTAAAWTLRITSALVWIYQGAVPKLLFPNSGELDILRSTGLFSGREASVLTMMGGAEILIGVALLWWMNSVGLLWAIGFSLLVLLGGAAMGDPSWLIAPFNPVSLTVALLGLMAAELWLRRDPLPDASRCKRVPPVNTRPLS
jgi:hypothetical protein